MNKILFKKASPSLNIEWDFRTNEYDVPMVDYSVDGIKIYTGSGSEIPLLPDENEEQLKERLAGIFKEQFKNPTPEIAAWAIAKAIKDNGYSKDVTGLLNDDIEQKEYTWTSGVSILFDGINDIYPKWIKEEHTLEAYGHDYLYEDSYVQRAKDENPDLENKTDTEVMKAAGYSSWGQFLGHHGFAVLSAKPYGLEGWIVLEGWN